MLLLPALFFGPLVLAVSAQDERESHEMKEQNELARQRGYATGVTGEFFRYKHLYYKQPTEADRDEAQRLAAKLRCDVCTALLVSLVRRAKSLSEDDLAEALEGDVDHEITGDPVTDQMLSHKKGCNKHFKDELVAEGYSVRVCRDVIPSGNDSEPCLYHDENAKPNQQAVDSYEIWKEGLFHACEQTVSRHSDVLAEYLSAALRTGGNRTAIMEAACKTQARCSLAGTYSSDARRPERTKAAASPRQAPREL